MSFSARSQVTSANRTNVQFLQSASGFSLSGANNWSWFSNLNRGTTTFPGTTITGTFGAAPGGQTFDRTSSGALIIPNAASGHVLRVTKVRSLGSTIDATIALADRLLDVAVDQTITTSQTLNTGSLPSRSSGAPIMALEANASLSGAGSAVQISISYTNQSGTSGRTSTLDTGTTTWSVFKNGTMLYMPLQAGDYGVQSVQTFQITGTASTTTGAGKLGVVLFDPILMFDSTIRLDMLGGSGGAAEQEDWIDTALASFDPNACLELHHHCAPSQSTTGTVALAYDFDVVID